VPDDRLTVLLDTDIGTNIDDALALAWLLSEPRCALAGITTVTGRPQVRARLADAICRAFGRPDVPIHGGSARPLCRPVEQEDVPQAAVLERHPHREDFAGDTAVDFLQRTIRDRPGEITLLTIGPLTNIARLLALDPEIPGLLRRHVMMGGACFGAPPPYGPAERNVRLDPEAAAAVLSAGTGEVCALGLDVTTRCAMPSADLATRLRGGPAGILADLLDLWHAGGREQVILHDPLAAVATLFPQTCTWRRGRIRVDTCPDGPAGRTHLAPCDDGRHRVAADVRPELFFEHFLGALPGT